MINKKLLSFDRGALRYVGANVAFQWLGMLCNVIFVRAIAQLVGAAFAGSLTSAQLWQNLVLCLATVPMRFAFTMLASAMSNQASKDVKRTLRSSIYAKLARLGPNYTETAATSEVVMLASEGVEQIDTYFAKYLPQLFYSLLAPVTLFVLLVGVHARSAIILLCCVPLIPMSIVAVQKFAKKLLANYWGEYTTLGDSFLENIQGLTTLKIYQADGWKHEQMNAQAERFRKITMKVLTMQLNSVTLMDLMAYGGAGLGIISAVAAFAAGRLTLTATLTIVLLAADFFLPLRLLGSYFHIAMNGAASAEKIFKLLAAEEPADGDRVPGENTTLKLEHVTFGYEKDRTILNDVSFTIPQGSFVSLVGESGCGKSTIAALLSGSRTGYTGSVTLGGVPVQELQQEQRLRTLTLVPHNATIFKGTVESNLRMAKPDADEAQLWAALEQVNLADFCRSQNGLQTALHEGGSNLSGGQRQRLAMARALLHDTPIYLFDEATSNVDAESENDIMQAIHSLAGKKTIILISHRLANVVHSDCIYAMSNGRVIEQGTHAELLAGGLQPPVSGTAAAGNTGRGGCLSMNKSNHRSPFAIVGRLIVLVKPMLPVMLAAIVMGVAGHFCATFITIFGGFGILRALGLASPVRTVGTAFACILVFALLRGVLRYAEQASNHYIAFKLLALIRDKVFGALRRLTPAKLEGRDRGDLISLITADIEALEVFYAHTISPICIACICVIGMTGFVGSWHILPALVLLTGYLLVGVALPVWSAKRGDRAAREYRQALADTNSYVLESLRGLKDTLQYQDTAARAEGITAHSEMLGEKQRAMKYREGLTVAITNTLILLTVLAVLGVSLNLYQSGKMGVEGVLVCTLSALSSFGPVVALANLGASLTQVFASADRVLDLLDEQPVTADVTDGTDTAFAGAAAEHVNFAYANEEVLHDLSLTIPEKKIVGITGRSGSGKSTFLRLLMRFWDVSSGSIRFGAEDIRRVNTAALREQESLVTQETELFDDTIENNIRIAKRDATREEVEAACKKAALDGFIHSLPKGYDTPVGELGGALSGGERQRIGVARAFLHDAPFLLLDEPTSNLDSLNEGVILKAVRAECKDKTVLLVSHRKSTMAAADISFSVESGRLS